MTLATGANPLHPPAVFWPQNTSTSCFLAPLPDPCPFETPHFLGFAGWSLATTSKTPQSTLQSALAEGEGRERGEPVPVGTLSDGKGYNGIAEGQLSCQGLNPGRLDFPSSLSPWM